MLHVFIPSLSAFSHPVSNGISPTLLCPFGSVLVIIGGCGFCGVFGHHLVSALRDRHLAWPGSVSSGNPNLNILSDVDYYSN
jgi:hypothetical protein